jgi:hypothetical protein
MRQEFESRGQKVLVTHFADLLKYICKQFFGWNGEKDEAGRSLLQQIGTEEIRFVFPDFWVDFLVNICLVFDGYWDYVIIPDCRFPNEIERFEDASFDTIPIKIERIEYTSELTEEQQKHSSETSLDKYGFKYYIRSKSGLDNLRDAVLGFLKTSRI